MATPSVGGGILHNRYPDWIQMNITGQLKQIGFPIDQDGLIAPLKQVPYPSTCLVDPPRVAKAQILYDPGKRNLTDLKGKVHVLC